MGSESVKGVQQVMTWASKTLGTPASEVIAAVRMGITVQSIATPRSDLVLREKDHWPDFVNDAKLADFDHVPVTENDEIVGMYDREKGTLRDLSESMFMAADASLLGYLEIADSRNFAFLVSESRIVGIVTLSDIQKLPVYCVLFSLLISVEMLLMECIRAACHDDPKKWISHLDKKQQEKIEDYWNESQQKNIALLDKLSCASFWHELTAAQGLELITADEFSTLDRLKELRDSIAHGKEIAFTPDHALEIPARVREASEIQDVLQEKLKGLQA
jgi:CBS domain-containing protein